ncbi:hypothetical protein MalM25_10790 [Planctomycetes bacterium MalM25]|nr:hypothetical protein MalM25_10790 [Planctomycetes bacterium MalM25]
MAGNHKGGGIKHLLLAHCEKAIALGIVLAAGYLIYSSMGVEGISESKTELTQLVSRTESAYEQSTWDEVPEENKFINHPIASGDFEKIPDGPYRETGGLNRPVVPPTVDRTDPMLLVATDLEGHAITGIFAFESEEEARRRQIEERRKEKERLREQEKARESGGELLDGGGGYGGEFGGGPGQESVDEFGRKTRPLNGQARKEGVPTSGMERFRTLSAACVLAKAPISDQFELYKAALEEARGYSEGGDIPRYLGLYVERAVVRDDEEELKWEPVKFGGLAGGKQYPVLATISWDKMVADWIPWPEPMVDSRYEHPVLTMPLPPLVQQKWGPKYVHSDAPLQVESDAKAASEEVDSAADEEEEDDEEEGSLFGRGRRDRAAEGGRGRGRTGRGGGYGGEYGGGLDGGGFGGEYGGEYGGGGMEGGFGGEYGGGGGGRGYTSRSSGGEYAFDPEIDFAMIRIWDFSVAPGRQYKYRVKLVLEDVNRNAPRQFLAPEVLARLDEEDKEYRTTEWSVPSPVISVPMAGDVFVSSAKLPSGRQKNAEGTIELLVQSYSLDEDRRSIKGGVKESFRRGSVINLSEDTWVVAPDGRNLVEIDSFKFNTGLTLMDYEGGEEVAGKTKAPVNVLLMDASGRLIVHNELDDHESVRAYEKTFEENDGSGGGGYGGGGYGGEYGGGGFGPDF